MTAALWDHNWSHLIPEGEGYWQPDNHEISEPMEFIAYAHDEPAKKKTCQQKLRLPSIDESMEAIE
jgi:hypothetical protein